MSDPVADGDAPSPVEEFLVIVHGSGRLEDRSAAAYWTEVPALSACMSEGARVEEALENTRRAIANWLLRTRGHVPAVRITPELAL